MKHLLRFAAFLALVLTASPCFADGLPPHITIVSPSAAMKACDTDADCVVVGIDCNMCCANDAVNKERAEDYAHYKSHQCAGSTGPVCNCVPCKEGEAPAAHCVQSTCESRCEPKP